MGRGPDKGRPSAMFVIVLYSFLASHTHCEESIIMEKTK